MVSAFATGTLLGVAAALARGLVVAVFSDDPGVAAYARSYLATVPLTFGVVGATVVAVSALQVMGSPWLGLAVAAARVALMAAAMLLAGGGLAGQPSPVALWVAIVTANVATCAGAYLVLRRAYGKLLRERMSNGAAGAAQGAHQWR